MSDASVNTPLYQRYNTDGVFARSVIAGLLYFLNHRITYRQVWEDRVSEPVTVPFAYNFAQAKDQRFAQDNYTFFGRECFSDKMIDGKFDMLPRFAVSYNGSSIDSGNITNRFVEAKYQKVEDGKISSYTAFLYSVPMTMNFECEGWIDNYDTAFKIEQKIIETFYKNKTFRVLYNGISVNCCVGFPESYGVGEKTVSYSFEQENQLKMTFTLAVECYLPCFDESMSIPSENMIDDVLFDVNHYTDGVGPDDRKVSLELLPLDDMVYPAGSEMHIRWKHTSNVSDMCTVILYYITPDGDRHIIDCPSIAGNEYWWRIPQYVSSIEQPSVSFMPDAVSVYEAPSVTVSPDRNGRVVDGCFTVEKPGKFSASGLVQVSCDRVDQDGNYEIHDCYVAEVAPDGVKSIRYFGGDEVKPFVCMTDEPLSYDTSVNSTKIKVGISYPLDMKIYNEIDKILII